MEGKMVRVIPLKSVFLKVPPVIYARFKAACVLEGIGVSQQVTELMEYFANDLFGALVEVEDKDGQE